MDLGRSPAANQRNETIVPVRTIVPKIAAYSQARPAGIGPRFEMAKLKRIRLSVDENSGRQNVRQIYLDYNATTPIAPSVVEAMNPFLAGHFGNPSSSHSMGRAAKEAIEDARSKIAGLLGCDREETVFTGCGTESNNLAIKGVMLRGQRGQLGHLVISAIEHPAVAEPARFLQRMGCDVTFVGCDENGFIRPSAVEAALRPDTRLVSIMHANNEIGTIQPIRQIAEICHGRNILVHTDASQSVGKIPRLSTSWMSTC